MTAAKGCVFVAMCAALAACAGEPQRPLPSGELDSQKIVLVNQWAETHGARLIWINYPTRNTAQKTE